MHNFLNGTPTSDIGTSTEALHAKASILWQRAYDISGKWKPSASFMGSEQFSAQRRSFIAFPRQI